MAHGLIVLATIVVAGGLAAPALAAEPVVSIWYRGSPAGVPKLDDLAAISAIGFRAVTWPAGQASGVTELHRMANELGLTLLIRMSAGAPRNDGTQPPTERLDVPVSAEGADGLAARVWRAVAQGAREISFDPGQKEGTGLVMGNGQTPAWVAPAVAFSRQLFPNVRLVDRLRPGPPVVLEPPGPPGLEVVLLDADQSWVIVATNSSRERRNAVARLPAGVPYALWVSWIDGSTIGMLSQPSGPRWSFEIDGGAALVYIIGKVQR